MAPDAELDGSPMETLLVVASEDEGLTFPLILPGYNVWPVVDALLAVMRAAREDFALGGGFGSAPLPGRPAEVRFVDGGLAEEVSLVLGDEPVRWVDVSDDGALEQRMMG